jgi:hypothetical protein
MDWSDINPLVYVRTALVAVGTFLAFFAGELSLLKTSAGQDAWTSAVDAAIAAAVALVIQILTKWPPGEPPPTDDTSGLP